MPSLTALTETTDSRRQYALQYLRNFTYPVELRTLAANIVAEERTIPVEMVSDDERERVVIRLHHIDMPKLVAEGIVAYDPESRMAVCTEEVSVERYADSNEHSCRSDAV
ncbi:MAG TPA: hypothetical protein VFJ06_06780 [Halococcus sp.]|nr:hypothetical protein [Halococcus sp.]